MDFKKYASFSDYLDDINRKKLEQGTQTQTAPFKKSSQYASSGDVNTNQSQARQSMEQAQDQAREQAKWETKQQHHHINGRFYLDPNDAARSIETKDTDVSRIEWLKNLRKSMGLTPKS